MQHIHHLNHMGLPLKDLIVKNTVLKITTGKHVKTWSYLVASKPPINHMNIACI